ncbi:hypothetical protein PINS_up017253 [Pythium insidiosum]|nr:hypothetical protein PINS_up017253 [Pythium insidiosum]
MMQPQPPGAASSSRTTRRTATFNYLDHSESSDNRLLFEHLESFREPTPTPPTAQGGSPLFPSAASGLPVSVGVFELLQLKFGFQASSVANQKENFACWMANYQLRYPDHHGSERTHASLWRVHQKFFKNYLKWCKFVRTEPLVAPENAPTNVLERQLALLLCIWGEAANLRFMPECVCFLYHSMAFKLPSLEALPNMPEGFYLDKIVRPIYNVIATMRTAGNSDAADKPVDHQDITNYDDINEFFWTPACLDFDELNIADALKVQDPKTFKEKRSVFNPLLAFFRVWFFLVVMFHVLVVIAYVGYYTRDDGATGLAYYGRWFRSEQRDLRNHAILSVFLTVTGLLALKVVLQIWLYGLRIFKDIWLALGVFARLFWHAFFFALFLIVNISPFEKFIVNISAARNGDEAATYLSTGGFLVLFYMIPVVLSSLVRMCFSRAIWGIGVLGGMDGTRYQYIGREMGQPWQPFMQYGASWSAIFFLKFLFTLELMVKPLMGPSIELFSLATPDEQRSNSVVDSNHNLMFVGALWAPVFVVYIYDSQIWFILYQSIVGLIMGLRSKMGSYASMDQLKAAMYTAPQAYDSSMASLQAQDQRVTTNVLSPEGAKEESLRLRFAIVWNEVISSFRLNDLLDDRETLILQYRIMNHGREVQNPIFLLAGKIAKAIELATKARSNKWTTQELMTRVTKTGIMDGITEGLQLARDIFGMLLGSTDGEHVSSVIDYLSNAADVGSLLNFAHLPAIAENMVEILGLILDIPENTDTLERDDEESQPSRVAFHDQTRKIIDELNHLFTNVELMINDTSVTNRLKGCQFLKLTTELKFQKQQLLSLYKADAAADGAVMSASRHNEEANASSTAKFARENFISNCTRLFFLLRLDIANAQPRCDEAKRRLTFFVHSLSMTMPKVASVEAMPSFSVMTPYYSETVLFTLDELKNPVHSNPLFERIDEKYKEKGRNDLTIMGYLITFHAEEWVNFMERIDVTTLEEAIERRPTEVRLWASLRGQTLARTVYGMMMYEDALRLLRWLELWNDASLDEAAKVTEMNRISALKFSYVTGCQIYGKQKKENDHRAADIDYLMKRFPSWRVSFVHEEADGEIKRYYAVLVKAENNEIVDVYRYELPGNPILGEGKPENQNVALPFTRGEYLQTIDMNQEHYFEEALKMPNFLATAWSSSEDVTIIGMKEHVFTGRASSLARFMTLQELVFVTLTQRVLATPLRARMHYGHPDVFEKSFVMTNGGVSKASKGINLSEDVFSGYNVTLRGGLVTHVEFMQCGKGRDVTLSQINAFEAKLSNGCAESCLSREGHRMSNNLDFFRLNSMFFGHFGFYICNALTVLCVYVYAYSKLYIATHSDVMETAATNTKELDSLAKVMSTQYILQFGLLTTLPLMSTLLVECGWKQALFQIGELISALGIVFYVFLTGTKAHYYDVALIRGGSKYRGTGRGFAITRDPMVNFFKEYGVSHFRKAVELIGVMILYGVYGNFDIGSGALEEFCATASFDCDKNPDRIPENITNLQAYNAMPQSYGVASFAVLLLGACWLLAPFLFNTDGLVLEKTKVDVGNWFAWMMRVKEPDELVDNPDSSGSIGTPKDSWLEWYEADVNLMAKVGPMGRLTYLFRELRHPLAMYFVFVTRFKNKEVFLLVLGVFAAWALMVVCGLVVKQSIGSNQKLFVLTARGVAFMLFGLGGLGFGPMFIGILRGWTALKGFTLSASIFLGLNSICQFAIALHGAFGFSIATWGPFVMLGFIYDMLVGAFLVVPLMVLSFLPFMRILQTRMLYNGGFSRALSSGSEVAASICILVGISGGYIFGFMSSFIVSLGYVNEPKYNFINKSFEKFINDGASTNQLKQWVQHGQLKALCSMIAVCAVIANIFLSKWLSRRTSMASGCGLIFFGLVLNFIQL